MTQKIFAKPAFSTWYTSRETKSISILLGNAGVMPAEAGKSDIVIIINIHVHAILTYLEYLLHINVFVFSSKCVDCRGLQPVKTRLNVDVKI